MTAKRKVKLIVIFSAAPLANKQELAQAIIASQRERGHEIAKDLEVQVSEAERPVTGSQFRHNMRNTTFQLRLSYWGASTSTIPKKVKRPIKMEPKQYFSYSMSWRESA